MKAKFDDKSGWIGLEGSMNLQKKQTKWEIEEWLLAELSGHYVIEDEAIVPWVPYKDC
jgi:hypothetical protein